MKNYLLFSLVGFLLISCSTTKLENEIIENFLNEKHKNDTEKVFLINKALSKKSALSIYEYAYNRRDLTYYLSHPLKDKNNWLLNTTTLIRLKKLYNKDTITYYWKKTDFENLNVSSAFVSFLYNSIVTVSAISKLFVMNGIIL